MELVGAPSWVSLKDDLNGSAILGGAASADANATSLFKVRALDMDGGYADLNVSLSLSDNLNAETLSDSFPPSPPPSTWAPRWWFPTFSPARAENTW